MWLRPSDRRRRPRYGGRRSGHGRRRARRAAPGRCRQRRSVSPRAGMPEPPSTFGLAPGAGRVDHRRGEQLGPVGQADQERRVLAAGGPDPVEAHAGDGHDGRVVADLVAQLRGLGQRREVGVDQVAAGRQRAQVRFGPAAGLQQAPGRGVDVVAPRAEQPHVPPLVDRRRDARPGLEDDEVDAAFGQMRGRGQADRAGADHHHRRFGLSLTIPLPILKFI